MKILAFNSNKSNTNSQTFASKKVVPKINPKFLPFPVIPLGGYKRGGVEIIDDCAGWAISDGLSIKKAASKKTPKS